jgi:hypothetical protein
VRRFFLLCYEDLADVAYCGKEDFRYLAKEDVYGRRPRRKDRPRCGGKTRAGGTCKVRVEFGKARCRGTPRGPMRDVWVPVPYMGWVPIAARESAARRN